MEVKNKLPDIIDNSWEHYSTAKLIDSNGVVVERCHKIDLNNNTYTAYTGSKINNTVFKIIGEATCSLKGCSLIYNSTEVKF